MVHETAQRSDSDLTAAGTDSMMAKDDVIAAETECPESREQYLYAQHDEEPCYRSRSVLYGAIAVGCMTVYALHASGLVSSIFTISYAVEDSRYGKGPRDGLFVAFYVFVFLSFRQQLVHKMYPKIAHHVGANSKSRYAEQLFALTYFASSTAFGAYVTHSQGLWQLKVSELVDRSKISTLDGTFKAYYLLSGAFWIHEAMVLALKLEKARPDRNQLLCHHIVAIALIFLSYSLNLTDFGLMILVPHDLSDAMLSVSEPVQT
jgi:hypothetical protein